MLDLFILHQPMPARFDATVEAYRALETLLADGRVRAIGVSNFMPDHLESLLEQTSVVPAVNQVEVHPYFSQPEVRAADAAHGIVTQAWSPIGGITFYRGRRQHPRRPGDRRDRSRLRQDAGTGHAALAPAGGPVGHPEVGARGADRRELRRFDFELTAAELEAIDRLDTGVRGGPDPAIITTGRFARTIPEA